MTRSTRSGLPKREARRGGDRLPARESTRGRRKNLEAIRDSVCAALGAAGYWLDDEEEEKEEDETTDRRQPLAAFSNIRASTPGTHGTPFISRRGGRIAEDKGTERKMTLSGRKKSCRDKKPGTA